MQNKPTEPFATLGVTFALNDIDIRTVTEAFAGISWQPERRATEIREDYMRQMRAVSDRFQVAADSHPDKAARLSAALSEYRAGYLKRVYSWLRAKGRVISSHIVGGVRKEDQNKIRDAFVLAMQREQTLYHYAQTRPDRLLKQIVPRQVRADRNQAVRDELKAAEAELDLMKRANAAIKKGATVADLVALGLNEGEARLRLKPDGMGDLGYAKFEVASVNGKIKRIKKKLEEVEARSTARATERTVKGVIIEEDPEADRLRLHFPERPSEEMRQKLRGEAFRWAPSEGAWQRQLTDNARAAAERVLQ